MKESIKNFIWERREIFLIIAILFFIGMPCIALLCHNFPETLRYRQKLPPATSKKEQIIYFFSYNFLRHTNGTDNIIPCFWIENNCSSV